MTKKFLASSYNSNVWIFQTNPKDRYDIFGCLADPEYKGQITWDINQYKDSIKKGGMALIWVSGKNAGIIALGKIISDPELTFGFPFEDKHWLNESYKGKECLGVIIEIIKDMTKAPLFRKKLKNIPALKNLSILCSWRRTNFDVKNDEWEIIKKMIW